MQRPYRVLASAVTAAVLVGAAACSQRGGGAGEGDTTRHRSSPADRVSPAASPSAAAGVSALTDAQAAGALLRADDLGWAWGGTKGAATWRDGLLKGRANRPECQELLDTVYAEDLLGEPVGGSAAVGFDDGEYGAQLRHQVGQYKEEGVDAKLGHVRELTDECGEFDVTGAGGRTHAVKVVPVDLPAAGDARRGLRMTVNGGVEGKKGPLTLDVAAVRVGDGAALLTHGGLYGVDGDTTRRAVERGAQRLKEVQEARRTGRTPKDQESPAAGESPDTQDGDRRDERNQPDEQEEQEEQYDAQEDTPQNEWRNGWGNSWQDDQWGGGQDGRWDGGQDDGE
ncbi:hypothetical protein [Streptomyces poonensis]|nr:hypothetical protein [Streptomyces poonensis]